jgi:hypothetical protein
VFPQACVRMPGWWESGVWWCGGGVGVGVEEGGRLVVGGGGEC